MFSRRCSRHFLAKTSSSEISRLELILESLVQLPMSNTTGDPIEPKISRFHSANFARRIASSITRAKIRMEKNELGKDFYFYVNYVCT